MKKFLCLLLSLTILFSFTGCNESEKQEGTNTAQTDFGSTGGLELPLDTENTKLTALVSNEGGVSVNDTLIAQKLREITGINLQIEAVPTTSVAEKSKVLIASKQIPDLMFEFGNYDQLNELGMQGAFAPVNKYLDIMPNFRTIFSENPQNKWVMEVYKAGDGNVYHIPSYDQNRDINTGVFMYRKDIFDKHGIKMWNSSEEFYQALKKLKEIYPDSVPFTMKSGIDGFFRLGIGWGIKCFQPYYDEENKIWAYSDTSDECKDMLDFIKKLYNEGLFEKEFATITQSAWTAKMTAPDKTFVTCDWIGRLEIFKAQTAETVPDYDLRFAKPMGPKGTYEQPQQIGYGNAVAAGKNEKLAMLLSDYLLSPAGAELMTLGIKDVTYTIGEDGMAQYLGFADGETVDITSLSEKHGLFISLLSKRFDRRSVYFNFSEREQEAQDFAKNPENLDPLDPQLALTAEEQEIINKYTTELQTAAKEFFMKYIVDESYGEKEWEEWKKKAVEYGSEEIVKVYNTAQKR